MFKPVNGSITGSTTTVQRELVGNGNEMLLHTPQIFRTRASFLDSPSFLEYHLNIKMQLVYSKTHRQGFMFTMFSLYNFHMK